MKIDYINEIFNFCCLFFDSININVLSAKSKPNVKTDDYYEFINKFCQICY